MWGRHTSGLKAATQRHYTKRSLLKTAFETRSSINLSPIRTSSAQTHPRQTPPCSIQSTFLACMLCYSLAICDGRARDNLDIELEVAAFLSIGQGSRLRHGPSKSGTFPPQFEFGPERVIEYIHLSTGGGWPKQGAYCWCRRRKKAFTRLC